MDNIERKLCTNNAVVIRQVFSVLLERARTNPSFENYIKTKCLDVNVLVADAARLALFQLVVPEKFEQLLREFTTSTSNNSLGLLKTIQGLLRFYPERYTMLNDPLVKILQYDTSMPVQLALNQRFSEVHKSLYKYCILNVESVEIGWLKSKIWTLLIENNKLDDVLLWLPIDFHVVATMLDELLLTNKSDKIVLLQILTIHNLVLKNIDCKLFIDNLLESLQCVQFCHHNLCLLILAQSALVCSSGNLESFFTLCYFMADNKLTKPFAYFALKVAVLHWMANAPSLKIFEKILNLEQIVTRFRPKVFINRITVDRYESFYCCNPELFMALQLSIHAEDEGFIENKLVDAPIDFLQKIHPFLCGQLISPKTSLEDCKRLLKILLNVGQQDVVLTVILYKLANSCELHFDLMKSLPKLAKLKENLPKITATLQEISKQSKTLESFSLVLLFETFQIDGSIYPTLEGILTRPDSDPLARTEVLRRLAKERPELYGKQLVAHFSKILNEPSDVIQSLAIDGIRHLCLVEIIDIFTTWTSMERKFRQNYQSGVIKSLSRLLGEIPHLEYTDDLPQFHLDAVNYLWNCVERSEDEQAVQVALDNLANFDLQLILDHMPEKYVEDGATAWINFLILFRFKSPARSFLIKLIKIEIDGYLKYIYQVKSNREPDNYNALSKHSVVKSIGDYLKHNFQTISSTLIDCLQILSQTYSKPLPPLNWCFLQELLYDELTKYLALDLAANQVVLCGSARRLIENYIVATTDNVTTDAVNVICRNLLAIANSIQPIVLKPFIKVALTLENSRILEDFERVLVNPDVQAVNKDVIEEALSDVLLSIDVSNKMFDSILRVVPSMSKLSLEKLANQLGFDKLVKLCCELSKIDLWWLNRMFQNQNIDLYYQDLSAVLRQLASNRAAPKWLNELFGDIQANVADQTRLTDIHHKCQILSIAIVEFSGLAALLPNNYNFDSIKYYLPAGLGLLLKDDPWNFYTPQILEWLCHMNRSGNVPDVFKTLFGRALCCLRTDSEFRKSKKWIKYSDCDATQYTSERAPVLSFK